MQQGNAKSGARRLVALAVALALLAAACGGGANGEGPDSADKGTIVFADVNWQSSEIQTRIVAYIVEHGYGYPVELISGRTILLFQGLERGDVDVFMEVWLPSVQERWDQARADGTVVRAGQTLRDNWEGFVVPQHVKDEHPGLVSVTDLPEYAHLFATAGSHGMARFLNCVEGWECASINEHKFESYGLRDFVHVVDPGSEVAAAIELRAAEEMRRPWFGYAWSPSIATAEIDLYRLEEPPYTDECWATDQACAYPVSTVTIAAHASLPGRAPDVVAFLGMWDYSTATHHELIRWMDEHNASIEEAVDHFLRTMRDVWSAFVPYDVAERVDAALAEG